MEEQQKKPVLTTKCQKCGKEGWRGNDQHEDGDIKQRLFIMLTGQVFCENCLPKKE